jgi:hypothetical protein
MLRPLAALLKDLIGTAERQVDAARRLDKEALELANEARQDLNFELRILLQDAGKIESQEIRDDIVSLGRLDQRLNRILSSVNTVFTEALNLNSPPTYGADGRIAPR